VLISSRSVTRRREPIYVELDEGTPPEVVRNQSIAHASAVAGVAGAWLYHGLVPKLLAADDGELLFWHRLGLGRRAAIALVRASGIGEIAVGVATARWSRQRWPFVVALAAMPALTAGALFADRRAWSRAFNPVSLNGALAALSVVALATRSGSSSGPTPCRHAPDQQPDVEALP
jgi:hypothetical protein